MDILKVLISKKKKFLVEGFLKLKGIKKKINLDISFLKRINKEDDALIFLIQGKFNRNDFEATGYPNLVKEEIFLKSKINIKKQFNLEKQ